MPSTTSTFAWPPKPAVEPVAIAAPEAPTSEPRPSLYESWLVALREVEREWLDPVSLPLAERARDAEWQADPPSNYCEHCGCSLGEFESSELGCSRCASARLPWDRCVRLGSYAPPLAEWICEVKFTRFRALGYDLGRALGRSLRVSGLPLASSRVVIVPVPCSLRRRLSRGIDHAAVIARGVAWELGLPLVRALRRRHRPSQRAVALSARVSNVSGSMLRRNRVNLSGTLAVLIDDVMTTGATMRAAARSLRTGLVEIRPRSVWAAVAAVTPDPG